MIFSLFSFRALSLFKFNVHFNFHFHCLGFKVTVFVEMTERCRVRIWIPKNGNERIQTSENKLLPCALFLMMWWWWCEDDDEVAAVFEKVPWTMAIWFQNPINFLLPCALFFWWWRWWWAVSGLQIPMRGNEIPNIKKEVLPCALFLMMWWWFGGRWSGRWSHWSQVRFQIPGKAMYFQALKFKIYCRGRQFL